MGRATFVQSTGVSRDVEIKPGISLMEAAIDAGVPEVETDCGGVCTCAACHVIVDAAWLGRLEPMSKNENALLGLLDTREPASRLSCQIRMNDCLDGIVVRTLAVLE